MARTRLVALRPAPLRRGPSRALADLALAGMRASWLPPHALVVVDEEPGTGRLSLVAGLGAHVERVAVMEPGYAGVAFLVLAARAWERQRAELEGTLVLPAVAIDASAPVEPFDLSLPSTKAGR